MPVRTRSAARAQALDISNSSSSSSLDEPCRRRSSCSSTSSDGSSDNERGKSGSIRKQSRKQQKFTRSISSVGKGGQDDNKEPLKKLDTFDVKAYLDKRLMTTTQEYFNAITMVPGICVSLYFVLSGCWTATHHQHGEIDYNDYQQQHENKWTDMAHELFGIESGWESYGCINSSLFPALTALPPLTIIAAALGNLVHSVVSIYYHITCATTLMGGERITHWTRRLDNASIHFASIGASYATSGRLDYCLLNFIYNVDCMHKQLEVEVHPRRNQTRLAGSILLYVLPVLVRGDYTLFLQFLLMFSLSGWLFGCYPYPFGGYAHGLFHLVLAFLPYLVFQVPNVFKTLSLPLFECL